MAKFLKYLISFFIPILIFALTTEVLIRYIPNRFKLQSNYLNTKANNIETLILGSSHSLYNINPEFISSPTFNSSNVSQTIDLDFEILKKFDQKLSNLKTLVIRLSYTTLFEKLNMSKEKWRMKDYMIYFGIQRKFSFIQNSELLSVKLKTNLHRLFQFYIQDKNMVETTSLGWGTEASYNYSKNLEKSGIMAAKKHTIEDKSLFDENFNTIHSIVSYCNKRNIKVILITFPAYKSYTSNLDFDQLEATISLGESLEKMYDNCSYYNFIFSDLFDSNDFFDADHLNKNGAKKFSLLLNDILKQ